MKRAAQKQQTRNHLLNMAYGQFSQKGFLATKTLDIATAAGVSHGALFVHFPTKDELLEKVIDEFGLRLGTKLKELYHDRLKSSHLGCVKAPGLRFPQEGPMFSNMDPLAGTQPRELSRNPNGYFSTDRGIMTNGTAKEVLAAHLEAIEEYESFYANLVIEGPLLPPSVRNRAFMIQSGIAHYLEKTILSSKTPIHFLLNSWLGLIHYYLANRDKFAPGKSVIATCGKDLLNHFIKTYQL